MRKLRLFQAAILLLASSGSAGAEEVPAPRDNTLELGGMLGMFMPSDDHEFFDALETNHKELENQSLDFGIRIGYLPIRFAGVEIEGDLIPTGTAGGDDAMLLGFRGHVLAQLPLQVTPFALAGFGTMGVRSTDGALGRDADFVGHFGLGVKYFLHRNLLIRTDGRLIVGPKEEEIPGRSEATSHFALLFSASYVFDFDGGPPEPTRRVRPHPDPDGDGFLANVDECPREAGEPPDGCPREDRDGDGTFDRYDDCPDEPETVNEFEDEDGCPDEIPDSDGDGLSDQEDECVESPEDEDGYQDGDGCPDHDNDGDGVTDAEDSCPDEVGPVPNRGCPDTDKDGDGVVDRLDNCPEEPGQAKNQGCKKPQLVVITPDKLEIRERVHFRTNSAQVRGRSRELLDNVARVLLAHPEIEEVRVEGHTDDRGPEDENQELSRRRADSVMSYLIEQGVPAERLVAKGFGESDPVESNETRAGRAANRRVELHIAGRSALEAKP